MVDYNLPIKTIILNNSGYGIIKQFQEAYFDSRFVVVPLSLLASQPPSLLASQPPSLIP